jgi:dienelactone hydrolase
MISHIVTLPANDAHAPLRVRVSTPTDGTGLPVLVFSHGYGAMGASMETYQPLVDHWVESGFVVVQPNHLDAEGLAPDDPRNAELWRLRIGDLTHVIDELARIEAAVPGLSGRLDHAKLAVGGHSYGATSTSALAGARVVGADGAPGESFRDPRVRAAVLLCLAGTGGDDLSPFARESFPFMSPDFAELTTPALLVAGDADRSPLTVRGPDWFTDAFRLAPGVTDLLTLLDGEHSLGGINGYEDEHTTDESPERVALVQQATTAWLRGALGLDDDAWPFRPDVRLGRVESK